MIKETVDAVRVAELEAEQTINTANENALGRKKQIKCEAEQYRIKALQEAEKQAQKEMQDTVKSCTAFTNRANEKIEEKVKSLRELAHSRSDKAVDAVIQLFV